jgi:NAD+ kinase
MEARPGIERVAMVVHDGKPQAVELQRALTGYLAERAVTVGDDAQLVVSLGGDGTMLRAARLAHSLDAPLLGVNLGLLGYLSEVDPTHARAALDRIFAGDFEIEERMMLHCAVMDADNPVTYVGLNEVLVERSGRHRLVRLTVKIGGESLAAFNADGVIVATPTGSTAYALSAGGPIVSPRAECLILVPISAHMIFSRPFVLSGEETVEIAVEGEDQEASLSLDGNTGCSLRAGTPVVVRRDERPLRLVRLGAPGFVERLRIKLDLPV